MSKQLKLGIVILVAVNIAIVGWLQLSSGSGSATATETQVLDDLLEDNTMEAARYDLSEQADRLILRV